MRHLLFSSALFLGACSDGFGDGNDGGAADGGSSDGGAADGGSSDGGAIGEGLPDLGEDLGPGGCDELDGNPAAGAAAWFLGTYERGEDDDWIGVEEYRLYANPAWVAQGGADCSVVWTASAADAGTGACGSCDLGISATAELDPARTTCPEGLYSGEETFSVSYAVDLLAENRAAWYFAETGTALGDGFAISKPDRMNFVTERTCQWFGG